MIILDEYSYAKNLLKNGLTSFMSGRDIRILTIYYRHIGIEENDLYSVLVDFLKEKEEDFIELSYQEFLLSIIKTSKKSKIKKFDSIIFTENEFNKIRSLKDYRLEKIIFTMLFLSKYYFQTGKYFDEENTDNYTLTVTPYHILKFAKVSPKTSEWLFDDLRNKGILDACHIKKGGKYILDFCKNDDSDPKIIIEDINNFIDYYKPYCEVCGKEIEKRNNKHFLCDNCWRERKKEHTRESMRRIRQNVIQ